MRPLPLFFRPDLLLFAALLALLPGPSGLRAQTAQPADKPIRLSSSSPPELLAAVELNLAVRKGDLARAEKILAGAPLQLAEAQSRQALLVLAAQEGQPAIVQWLLEKGANPHEASGKVTPLDAALGWTRDIMLQRQEEDPETWKLLGHYSRTPGDSVPAVPPPANSTPANVAVLVEALNRFFAPLPPALLLRKAQVVELLLAAGAKPQKASAPGAGPPLLVFDAVLSGFGADVINRLIQAGADPRAAPETTRATPLHVAAMNGNLGAAEALLAHQVDLESLSFPLPPAQSGMKIGSGGNTPLMAAIMLSQEEMVRFLLGQGARLETTNRTLDRAVHFAAAVGHPEILRLLLDRGARVNVSDRWQSTPLHYAAGQGSLEAMKLLLDARADLEATDEAGFTPLLDAVEKDKLEPVKYLLAQGASRRARTDMGKGPLRVAVTTNALQVAEFLLDLGENVNGGSSDEMRPLHEAASSGFPLMVTLLLQHGASTDVRDRAMQSTPLGMAVRCRPESAKQWLKSNPPMPKSSYALVQGEGAVYLEIVRLLAAQGADLNATDRWRNTALHLAAEYGDREAVELLLTLGARRDLVNARDMTPYDIALLKGHREISVLLQPATAPAP